MSPETQSVTSEKFIKAPAAQVYLAFTNATLLKEWLCDVATVSPKPGGRMYLWWNGDFYSSGEYVDLEPNRSITFQWFGRGESIPTQVAVTLSKKKGGTLVIDDAHPPGRRGLAENSPGVPARMDRQPGKPGLRA